MYKELFNHRLQKTCSDITFKKSKMTHFLWGKQPNWGLGCGFQKELKEVRYQIPLGLSKNSSFKNKICYILSLVKCC